MASRMYLSQRSLSFTFLAKYSFLVFPACKLKGNTVAPSILSSVASSLMKTPLSRTSLKYSESSFLL